VKLKGWAAWFALVVLVVGLLAPILANDRPVVARVNGELRFPALCDYFGERAQAPAGKTWKRWWVELEDEGNDTDWALMPFIPYGPFEVNLELINKGPEILVHYLGNDDTGRDLLARLIHGAGTAAWIALGVVFLSALIGVGLGAWAGYCGGWADVVVQRLVEIFLCFPALFFVLAVLSFVGNSTLGVVLVLAFVYWTSFTRIVRGELMSLREREFVQSARSLGVGPMRLVVLHLLPSARGPILVNAAFVAASAIVVESTLSFLNIGPGLASVSWGSILQQGRSYAHAGAWHLWFFPGLVLIATVMCLHSLADRKER
jgi:peptide/nickel transport system permease protein